MKRILQYFVMVVCIPIFCSCQSNGKNQIKTAADWVAYCQDIGDPLKIEPAEARKECFIKAENGFKSIKSEDVPIIYEELVKQISTDDINSALMKDKCYAFVWLSAASFAHLTYLENNFTEGQRIEIADIDSKVANNRDVCAKLAVFVGEDLVKLLPVAYAVSFSEEARRDFLQE